CSECRKSRHQLVTVQSDGEPRKSASPLYAARGSRILRYLPAGGEGSASDTAAREAAARKVERPPHVSISRRRAGWCAGPPAALARHPLTWGGASHRCLARPGRGRANRTTPLAYPSSR